MVNSGAGVVGVQKPSCRKEAIGEERSFPEHPLEIGAPPPLSCSLYWRQLMSRLLTPHMLGSLELRYRIQDHADVPIFRIKFRSINVWIRQ
jgi:hypothetical protein